MTDSESISVSHNIDSAAESFAFRDDRMLRNLLNTGPATCRLFWDDEDAYLCWVDADQDGYMVNCDNAA